MCLVIYLRRTITVPQITSRSFGEIYWTIFMIWVTSVLLWAMTALSLERILSMLRQYDGICLENEQRQKPSITITGLRAMIGSQKCQAGVKENNENCQEEEESCGLFMSQRVWRHQAAKKKIRNESGRYLILKISICHSCTFPAWNRLITLRFSSYLPTILH